MTGADGGSTGHEYNLAEVHEAVEATVPDRLCIVFRERELTYHQVGDRTRQLANALRRRGLGSVVPRRELAGHESGQDHLALYLHNGNEYLEGMLGAFEARVAPFNVNYRYVAAELEYLLLDAGAKAVIYHSAFAPVLDAVRPQLPHLDVLLQVADDSGNGLLDGAEWYEDALGAEEPALDPALVEEWSPDDLYILCTGGTTGMPKGVLWRQGDIFPAAMGGRSMATNEEWASIDDLLAVAKDGGARLMPVPPFMHGASQWMAFNAFAGGNTLVLPKIVERYDPADVLTTIATEGVNIVLIVGDAFGRPLVEEMERGAYDMSSMLALVSGGAPLSAVIKDRLLDAAPSMIVMDGLGASETGSQAAQTTAAGAGASTGTFSPGVGVCVLDEDMSHELPPGHEGLGWLAQSGRVPLGYLGDPEKTARTFPVINGVRRSVPGDRAALLADGTLSLKGRDSVTINSGGEKIFAEEVEAALSGHPDVADVVVVGRPSERWGQEVVAVVALREGATPAADELEREAERHIARYKLPKHYVFADSVQRSPAGKADYRWATSVAAGESNT